VGRVENKVAIVTGGAQGLGEAAVKLLTEEGARVILADANPETGGETAARYSAAFKTLDVREESGSH